MSRSLAGACENSDPFRVEATVKQQAETDNGGPVTPIGKRLLGRCKGSAVTLAYRALRARTLVHS